MFANFPTTLIPRKINSVISCLTNIGKLLQSHSVNVGEMATEFARVFDAQEQACKMGKLHDLGNIWKPLIHRLHGGSSVDHATVVVKIAKMLASGWVPKYKLWLSYLG